jgi:hypothetical protein
MRRRDFVILVSGSLAAAPLRALAQHSSKIWRIGFIAHTYEKFYDACSRGYESGATWKDGTLSSSAGMRRAA